MGRGAPGPHRGVVCETAYRLLGPCTGRNSSYSSNPGFPVDTVLGALAAATGRTNETRTFFERAIQQCQRTNLAWSLVHTQIA